MSGLLDGKNAIIYGGGGGVGAGVARVFAREGASVFLVGRTPERLQAIAAEIVADGGSAHCDVLDALDEQAVGDHVRVVVDRVGSVDVSFNLISRGDVQGTPLLDMDVEDFLRPIETGARSNFITARAAARQMVVQGAGVILMITSGSGAVLKPSPRFSMGGTGPADAATESFMHYLAAEVGPRGVRVLGLWTAGVFHSELMAPLSMLQTGPTLAQLADTAAFVASSRGSGITGSIINVSSGVSAN
jgi:NAD(P)-dependent dehydrogenase (short-subunit alcohol dehydrogenase family)